MNSWQRNEAFRATVKFEDHFSSADVISRYPSEPRRGTNLCWKPMKVHGPWNVLRAMWFGECVFHVRIIFAVKFYKIDSITNERLAFVPDTLVVIFSALNMFIAVTSFYISVSVVFKIDLFVFHFFFFQIIHAFFCEIFQDGYHFEGGYRPARTCTTWFVLTG